MLNIVSHPVGIFISFNKNNGLLRLTIVGGCTMPYMKASVKFHIYSSHHGCLLVDPIFDWHSGFELKLVTCCNVACLHAVKQV